jgi:hypothetical protein
MKPIEFESTSAAFDKIMQISIRFYRSSQEIFPTSTVGLLGRIDKYHKRLHKNIQLQKRRNIVGPSL